MCLALPMLVTAIDGQLATIATEGLEQRASLMLVPEARVGDYVLVHAGYAISVLDEADARETIDLLLEVAASEQDGAGESGGHGSTASHPADKGGHEAGRR